MVENSLVWLMVSHKFEYMFELLLIIYLVPVIIVLSLLLRLVLWLARNVLRFAGWLVKKVCVLLWHPIFSGKSFGFIMRALATYS